jgi:protein SCO1/2
MPSGQAPWRAGDATKPGANPMRASLFAIRACRETPVSLIDAVESPARPKAGSAGSPERGTARIDRAGRRRALIGIPLFGLAAVGCDRAPEPAAPFSSIDLSGVTWGRGFRLQDADGRTVSLDDFRGRCVMLFFGFTQCPDICPTALARAADVMQRLGPQAARLQVIFVTVDPERDTPAVMREYPKAFHPSFIGLHGDLQTTAATADDFKVFYRKVPTGSTYTMDHTSTSFVFDPGGRLRLAVRHDFDAASVAADIARLLKENP